MPASTISSGSIGTICCNLGSQAFDNGRIEVLTPLLQENLCNNVMNQIVIPQLKDNIHAWVMNSDGSYTKLQPKKDETVYDSQEEIAKKLNLMKK